MRECDFCGTPALDERATKCEVCESPLPAVEGADAGPGGPEPVRPGQSEPFDAAATVASPVSPERAAAFGGPAPLRAAPEREPVVAPPIVEAADLAIGADPPPPPPPPAVEQPAPAPELEGDDFTDTVKPPSRSNAEQPPPPPPAPVALEAAADDDGDSWIVDSSVRTAPSAPSCPNCGRENAAGMAFCIQCGTRLGEAAPASDPVPVARLSASDPADGADADGAATVIAAPFAAADPSDAATIVAGPQPAGRGAFDAGAATVVAGSLAGDAGPGAPSDDSEKTSVFGAVIGVACEVCGADNDTVSAFCVRCGARLGQAASGPEAAAGTFAASGLRSGQDFDPADAPTIVPDLSGSGGPASRSSVVRTPTTRCPNCRASNDALAAFCVSCGTSLRPQQAAAPPPPPARSPAAPPKACPSCGTANEADVRFCVSCGNSLSRDPFAGQRTPEAPTAVGFSAPPPPPPAASPALPPVPPPLRDPFSRTPAAPPQPAPYAAVPGPQPSFSPPEAEESGGRFGPLMIIGIVVGAAVGAGVAFLVMEAMDVSPF